MIEQEREFKTSSKAIPISKIISHEFGVSNFNCLKLKTGETNNVYKINWQESVVILKIVNNFENSGVYKQKILEPVLSKIGIPVPKRLRSLEKMPFNNYGYIIDEWIESEPASDYYGALINRPLDREFTRNLGEIIKQIHSVNLEGFGDINTEGKGKFESWSKFLENVINKNLISTEIKRNKLPKDLLNRSLAFLSHTNQSSNENCTTSLVHGDLNLKNILFKNNAIVGVIDWDDAIVGDPIWDYARMQLWFEERMPIYDFIKTDSSIAADPKNILERMEYYKLLLATKEAIVYADQRWSPEAWSRLNVVLQKLGY